MRSGADFHELLTEYFAEQRNLRCPVSQKGLSVLGMQLAESCRRVRYFKLLQDRTHSSNRSNPRHQHFDPHRAALIKNQEGDFDEACWLVFYSVHFGKHRAGGWQYVRTVYGKLGDQDHWDWETTSQNPTAFRRWLEHAARRIRSAKPGGFGNHRKYESLDPWSDRGTGNAFETYVDWVTAYGSHKELFDDHLVRADGNPAAAFDSLFHSMNSVASFGRTARFDYLCSLRNLGLLSVSPGFPYLKGATGPLKGARLLICGNSQSRSLTIDQLEAYVVDIGNALGLGMQVMEDALCNWQKSPHQFNAFRG